MSEGARGLVLAHASFAAAMISAVRKIAGDGADALLPLSNDGCSPETLLENVREALGDRPAVIFTDLGSGSCAFAARRTLLDRPATAIVSGVNLPVLLDFVFHRELPLDELVERLVRKGKEGISGHTPAEAGVADRSAAG
jgi:mannose/fructose-specific phosphotransferase system component IIA